MGRRGSQRVGKQSEERTVSVRAHDVDGINETRGIEYSEGKDTERKDNSHSDVHTMTKAFIISTLTNIHAIGGGEGGKRRIGT